MEVVRNNHLALEYASEKLRNNKEFALEAICRDLREWQYVSSKLKNDKEFVLSAVSQNWRALRHTSAELQNDKEVISSAVKQDGQALQYASADFQNDKEIVLAAVSRDWRALRYASSKLKDDKGVILSAVKQDGQALQYASADFQNDKEIVLAAVSRDWRALRYASSKLKYDKGVILSAVKQDGMALQYTSDRLKNDTEIILTALQNNPMSLEFVNNNIIDDNKELFLLVLKMGKRQLKDANSEFCNDKNIVLAAIARDILAVEFIGEALRNNSDILALIQQKSSALINHLEFIIKNNYNIALAYLFDLHIDYSKLFVNDVPFLIVLIKSRSQFIESLICKINSATINLSDKSNKTALYYALETEQYELAKQLIISGATIKNILNKYLDYDFIKFALENNGDNYQYITETQYLDNIELARLARKTARSPAVTTILNYKIKRYELEQECVNDYLNVANLYQSGNYSEFITSAEFDALKVKFIQKWYQENIPEELPNNKEYHYVKIDDEQALAIATVNCNVKVTARAGSGKTATLVNRALFLHKHCKIQWNEMLIMAFNKKAAAEVNRRIEYITKFWDVDSPKITVAKTFHSVALSIAGIANEQLLLDYNDDGFAELNNANKSQDTPKMLILDIHTQLIKNKPEIQKKELSISMNSYLSPPEEGVRMYRMAKLHNNDKKILVLSKNSQCESEDDQLLGMLLSCCGELYRYKGSIRLDNKTAISVRFSFTSRADGNKYVYDQTVDINDIRKAKGYQSAKSLDLNLEIVKNFLQRMVHQVTTTNGDTAELYLRISENLILKALPRDELNRIFQLDPELYISFINYARQINDTPKKIREKNNGFVHHRKQSRNKEIREFVEIAADIYEEYMQVLKSKEKYDFTRLLETAPFLIEKRNHIRFGSKDSRSSISELKHLFIDEYQDFSMLFNQLVKAIRNKNTKILSFCVGDDWQAINGYAGSDLEYFNSFSTYFGDNSRNLAISTNYRSKRKVVELGNLVMEGKGKPSVSSKSEAGSIYVVNGETFTLNKYEEIHCNGNIFFASLLRIIQSQIRSGKSVVLLSRTKRVKFTDYISYTPEELLTEIKKYFPERGSLISVYNEKEDSESNEIKNCAQYKISTAHSFKGLQSDVVILLDLQRFPLINPKYEYQQILGQMGAIIVAEEMRLLYVAVTRPKSILYLMDFNGPNDASSIPEKWQESGLLDNIDSSSYPPIVFPEDKFVLRVLTPSQFKYPKFKEYRNKFQNPEKDDGYGLIWSNDLKFWWKRYDIFEFDKLDETFTKLCQYLKEINQKESTLDSFVIIAEVDGYVVRYTKTKCSEIADFRFDMHLHKIASKTKNNFIALMAYYLELEKLIDVLQCKNAFGSSFLHLLLNYPDATAKLEGLYDLLKENKNMLSKFVGILKEPDKGKKTLSQKAVHTKHDELVKFLTIINIISEDSQHESYDLNPIFLGLENQYKYKWIERFADWKIDFNCLLRFLIEDTTGEYNVRLFYLRSILYIYQFELPQIMNDPAYQELAFNNKDHDFIALVESYVLNKDFEQIQEEILARNVNQLLHFTSIDNLKGILCSKQILSKSQLQTSHQSFQSNYSYGNFRDHVFCSISSINNILLKNYISHEFANAFCILKIDPRYIYKDATYYSPYFDQVEYSKTELTIIGDSSNHFKNMFANVDRSINNKRLTITRDNEELADNQPTDRQAEVLIKKSIHVSDIIEIICKNERTRKKIRNDVKDFHKNFPWIEITVDEKMFELSENETKTFEQYDNFIQSKISAEINNKMTKFGGISHQNKIKISKFYIGDWIKHPQFGRGKITNLIDDEIVQTAEVFFIGTGSKVVNLSIVKIDKMQ